MSLRDYFNEIEKLIHGFKLGRVIQISIEEKDKNRGLIKIKLTLIDGSEVYLMEFVEVKQTTEKYKYRYHFQKEGKTIFRYDNSPHFPMMSTFPHHKHIGDHEKKMPCKAPELFQVLEEISDHIEREYF